jgi:hypothetical protein
MCGCCGCGFGGEWEEDAVVAGAFVEYKCVEVEVLFKRLLAISRAEIEWLSSQPRLQTQGK